MYRTNSLQVSASTLNPALTRNNNSARLFYTHPQPLACSTCSTLLVLHEECLVATSSGGSVLLLGTCCRGVVGVVSQQDCPEQVILSTVFCSNLRERGRAHAHTRTYTHMRMQTPSKRGHQEEDTSSPCQHVCVPPTLRVHTTPQGDAWVGSAQAVATVNTRLSGCARQSGEHMLCTLA